MELDHYRAIREELNKAGCFSSSNAHGLFWCVAEFLTVVGMMVLSYHYWTNVVLYVVFQCLAGMSMFKCFVLMHECGHRVLFRSERLNHVFGLLLSLFCLVPYVPWMYVHRQHHVWTGVVDKDPSAELNLKLMRYSRLSKFFVKWLYKAWIPVSAIGLIYFIYWCYPFKNWKVDRRAALKGGACVLLIVVAHVTIATMLGLYNYLLCMLLGFTVYLYIFDTVNLAHHSGLYLYSSKQKNRPIPIREQDECTRSTPLSKRLSFFVCYNFNFHTEHHYYPNLPFQHLAKVHDLVLQLGVRSYQQDGFVSFVAKLRRNDPVAYYLSTLPKKEDLPLEL